MSAGRSACLCWTLLSVCLLASSSAVKRAIRAEPGQTVSLPCKALNNDPVTAVHWSRTDLKEEEYVLLYRDKRFDTDNQRPSYKNRVDLQDRQMKDGDVSLILKNVKIEDSGTYECSVETKTSRRKRDAGPITIIKLNVVPGQTNITADPGQTVSLPCKALNNDPVIYVEWRRTDMKEDEYVLFYRERRLYTENQHPSYKNRVDLQDRQMKDGDVSLILNNVKIEDRGTYECYVVQRKSNRRKRDAGSISVIRLDVVPEKKTITADPGQTVSLPCKALNNETVIVVEWRRADMEEDEYVLAYRDKKLDPENQHPSYKNRVDLQDRQMKDGDVSLILNNVMIEDSGTYECYINQREKNIIKKYVGPISIIRLEVVPPGHTDEHKEDGGDKDGGDKDGRDKDGGEKDGSVGLIVGLIVPGVLLLLLGVAGFLIFRIRKHPYRPPPEQSADPQQLEMSQISVQLNSECPAAVS